MVKVFVSHASLDSPIARQIADGLEAEGVQAWLAEREVPPGSNYAAEIVNGIEGCAAFLVLLTPAGLDSVHVAREMNLAVENRLILIPTASSSDLRHLGELPPHWRYWLGIVQAAQFVDVAQVVRIVKSRLAAAGSAGVGSDRLSAQSIRSSQSALSGVSTSPSVPPPAPRQQRSSASHADESLLEARVRSEMIFIAAACLPFAEAQARARRLGFSPRRTEALAYRLREARLLDFDGALEPSTVIRLT